MTAITSTSLMTTGTIFTTAGIPTSGWRSLYCCDPTASSLIFFNDYKSYVIGLRRALGEFLDGLQELLLDRATSGGSFLPNDLQNSLLSEHFLFRVLRVRESIADHHQDVPLIEM